MNTIVRKIDRRRTYIMMTDTETCNAFMGEDGRLDLSCSLVYDIGWQVIDKRGNVYLQRSYIVDDIFNYEKDLMTSAYYAHKLPQYYADIESGKRIVKSFYEIRRQFFNDMRLFRTKIVACHNARFDHNALNVSQRWLTKSKYRYFFPYGTEIWDTLKMANDVICKMPSYIAFCQENGYLTKHKIPRPKATAEILYRYISGNNDFIESHTGLEDVDIERQILAYCFKQHKKMRKGLYEK